MDPVVEQALDVQGGRPHLLPIVEEHDHDKLRALVASSKHGDFPLDAHTATDDGGELMLLLRDLVATSNDGISPLEVLCNILLSLPARAVCRFRCVCTSWRSILRHPRFIAAHRARCPPAPLIAATVRLDRGDGMPMGVNLLDMSGNVVKMVRSNAAVTQGSLYGMCAHGELGCIVGRTDRRLHVLDVTTGATAAFPPRPRGALTCSLGRVPSTGEHKVLTVVPKAQMGSRREHGYPCYHQVAMVLTLGSKGGGWWRESGSPPAMVRRRHRDVAIVKGVAYFSVETKSGGLEQEDGLIVGFDLETEEWQPRPLRAPPAGEDHGDMSLAEVNGFLVAARRDRHASSVKLWFLMNVDETLLWFPLYKIPMAMAAGHEYSFEKPLWVMDDGRMAVWSSMYGSRDGMPQVYDPRTETLTQGAVTANCYAVDGLYTGCLLRVGNTSDPGSHKKLVLLDAAGSNALTLARTVQYGRRRRHSKALQLGNLSN